MNQSKALFLALVATLFALLSGIGLGQATDDKQAWVSVGQFRSTGNFVTCQRYDLSKLTSTLLTDQLKANGRFRIFENENVAELRFGGEITSCSVSAAQILFVTNVTVKFAVNITATDIVTSERVISETIEGETSLSGVSFIGTFLNDTDFKKAIEDVFKAKIPKLAGSKDLVPYMTHAPGERPVPRGSSNTTTQPTPPTATVPNASVNVAIDTMFNALKNMDFMALNNSFTDNLLSISSLASISQFATPENKELSSKIFYAVQSTQPFQNLYTVVDVLVLIPSKTGAPVTKSIRLGVVDTGGQLAQAFPTRVNQGLKVIFLAKENPYRTLFAGTFPIFISSSDVVEQLFKDFATALGIQGF
jgi:hypothetical protein